MKINIVGVTLKEDGKIYSFNALDYDLDIDDKVIVETEKGIQYGNVVKKNKETEVENINKYKNIIRVATKDDEEKHKENLIDANKALLNAKNIACKLSLNMKFVSSDFSFDRSQLTLYFLSDNRIDFRELAKQLASLYKTRIELRQIGVRDKAKTLSGIGQCGRKICCSLFLNDLDSVSINMAKNQNLALNPTKINGLCGRLLCCLKYEDDLYEEHKNLLPEIGSFVETLHGKGKVISLDIPNLKYTVFVENYGKVEQVANYGEECEKCQNKCK